MAYKYSNVFTGFKLKKPLSKEEQIRYLKLAVNDDDEAKNILFEHNMYLVEIIVNTKYYYKSFHDKEELFQEGCIGLRKAIQRFDITYGYDLANYAKYFILGEMRRYIRSNTMIQSPNKSKTSELLVKIISFKEKFLNKNNTLPLISDIEHAIDAPLEDIIFAINFNYWYSFGDIISADNENLSDFLALSSDFSDESMSNAFVEKMFSCLEEKEKTIATLLFGYMSPVYKQADIAKILEIHTSTVSRKCNKILQKLTAKVTECLTPEEISYRKKMNEKK